MSTNQPVVIKCKSCGKTLKFKAEAQGRIVKCSCGAKFRVPVPDGKADANKTALPEKSNLAEKPAGLGKATRDKPRPSRTDEQADKKGKKRAGSVTFGFSRLLVWGCFLSAVVWCAIGIICMVENQGLTDFILHRSKLFSFPPVYYLDGPVLIVGSIIVLLIGIYYWRTPLVILTAKGLLFRPAPVRTVRVYPWEEVQGIEETRMRLFLDLGQDKRPSIWWYGLRKKDRPVLVEAIRERIAAEADAANAKMEKAHDKTVQTTRRSVRNWRIFLGIYILLSMAFLGGIYLHNNHIWPFSGSPVDQMLRNWTSKESKSYETETVKLTPLEGRKRELKRKYYIGGGGRVLVEEKPLLEGIWVHGVKKEFDKASGKLKAETTYKKSKREGDAKLYDTITGDLIATIPYVKDKVHGIAKWYYSDGSMKREMPYQDGDPNGVENTYDKDGSVTETCKYEDGVAIDHVKAVLALPAPPITLTPFSPSGLFPVSEDEKYGFIDQTGRVIIAFQFEDAGHFSEEMADVRMNSKVGYIDTSGKVVIPASFKQGRRFSEGLASVQIGKKYGYIDKQGKIVIKPAYDFAWEFSGGMAQVGKGKITKGKWGYINKQGKLVIPMIYDYSNEFREELACVARGKDEDQKYGFINAAGKEIIPLKYGYAESFSEGLAFISTSPSSRLNI